MSVLNDALRSRIDGLIASHRVVLFMKGSPAEPRCGFSARVVELLAGHLDDYASVDILSDMTLREGLKVYADWPTFPQLWVEGELVGGADIVEQLHLSGELRDLLGGADPVLPSITVTDAARDRIHDVAEGSGQPLRLRIDARFRYGFELVDGLEPGDVQVMANGIPLVLDRVSARRADGMTLDFVRTAQGEGLVVDNPNEPATVQQLDVTEYARWRAEGTPHELIDVRTDMEWSIARIDGARLFDPDTQAYLESLPRDTPLVFQCHHGMRSQHAAEHFAGMGFRKVWNLRGGIDAWSMRVDPSVPRY